MREKTIRGKLMELSCSRGKGKKPEELFFLNTMAIIYLAVEQGSFEPALESVRLGPSASNFQPWPHYKEEAGKNSFHFYEKENQALPPNS